MEERSKKVVTEEVSGRKRGTHQSHGCKLQAVELVRSWKWKGSECDGLRHHRYRRRGQVEPGFVEELETEDGYDAVMREAC